MKTTGDFSRKGTSSSTTGPRRSEIRGKGGYASERWGKELAVRGLKPCGSKLRLNALGRVQSTMVAGFCTATVTRTLPTSKLNQDVPARAASPDGSPKTMKALGGEKSGDNDKKIFMAASF